MTNAQISFASFTGSIPRLVGVSARHQYKAFTWRSIICAHRFGPHTTSSKRYQQHGSCPVPFYAPQLVSSSIQAHSDLVFSILYSTNEQQSKRLTSNGPSFSVIQKHMTNRLIPLNCSGVGNTVFSGMKDTTSISAAYQTCGITYNQCILRSVAQRMCPQRRYCSSWVQRNHLYRWVAVEQVQTGLAWCQLDLGLRSGHQTGTTRDGGEEWR